MIYKVFGGTFSLYSLTQSVYAKFFSSCIWPALMSPCVDRTDSSLCRSQSSSLSSLDGPVSKEAVQFLCFAETYTRKSGRTFVSFLKIDFLQPELMLSCWTAFVEGLGYLRHSFITLDELTEDSGDKLFLLSRYNPNHCLLPGLKHWSQPSSTYAQPNAIYRYQCCRQTKLCS